MQLTKPVRPPAWVKPSFFAPPGSDSWFVPSLRRVLLRYGPPRDCEGKVGRETRLRKCIQPVSGNFSPGQDDMRAGLSL